MASLALAIQGTSPRRAWRVREVLQGLLILAAETCWVYALLRLTLGFARMPEAPSPFVSLALAWAGLFVGRFLPRARRAWWVLQAAALAAGILLLLGLAGAELYARRGVPVWGWPFTFVLDLLQVSYRMPVEVPLTLAGLFLYARGLGLSQRPITVWYAGFMFRIGVVVLFLAALVNSVAPIPIRPILFAYFSLSLLSISLARIHESGQERGLGLKWGLILLGGTAIVIGLGFIVGAMFEAALGDVLLAILWPVGAVLTVLLTLLIVPLMYLGGLLAGWIEPWLQAISQGLSGFRLDVPQPLYNLLQELGQFQAQMADLTPFLRVAALAVLLVLAGVWVARQLNRRLARYEHETFEVDSVDGNAPMSHPARRPRVKVAGREAEIHAENIRRVYAAFLQRAAARGLPRRAAETPYEFLPRAVQQWPPAGADLGAITAAYVAVHYGEAQATPAQVRAARQAWERARILIQPVEGAAQGGRHKRKT